MGIWGRQEMAKCGKLENEISRENGESVKWENRKWGKLRNRVYKKMISRAVGRIVLRKWGIGMWGK